MSSLDQQTIITNKFGEVFISNEDIKNYMVKYLDYMTDYEIEIYSMDIVPVSNQKFVFQLIVALNKTQAISIGKINHIRDSVDIIFRNHVGIQFESINIGVKYIND